MIGFHIKFAKKGGNMTYRSNTNKSGGNPIDQDTHDIKRHLESKKYFGYSVEWKANPISVGSGSQIRPGGPPLIVIKKGAEEHAVHWDGDPKIAVEELAKLIEKRS